MATATTRLRPYRRIVRRAALALSTVALAAGLALVGGALSPASASAGEHGGAERDGTVHLLALLGPYKTWEQCNIVRDLYDARGYETTPCFKDPQGWFLQYF
ncbi:hypothetical protein J2S43_002800 [Catenuloplanes nepalensis]|uniref:Uncharacterized protein n=1 Tax=Catenuloplanes nepalensis TaxID=587533 RepID=A0ABT9MS73_9ACTN|nr:hypothetical protein [Catenuloplanes nepalensis]MDP9794288.1 hypothetical protein [Catenuloplanes nepalensis]